MASRLHGSSVYKSPGLLSKYLAVVRGMAFTARYIEIVIKWLTECSGNMKLER